MVESFQAYLPERAASSGLVPRFQVLDREAEAADRRVPPGPRPAPVRARASTSGPSVPRTGRTPTWVRAWPSTPTPWTRCVLDYDAELTRIGAAGPARPASSRRRRPPQHARRVAAAAATLRAERARGPRAQRPPGPHPRRGARGQRLAAGDRVPGPRAGRTELDRPRPGRRDPRRGLPAARRQGPHPSYVAAHGGRGGRVAGSRGSPTTWPTLRREFSIGNWRDLEPVEQTVRDQLAEARDQAARLRPPGRGRVRLGPPAAPARRGPRRPRRRQDPGRRAPPSGSPRYARSRPTPRR